MKARIVLGFLIVFLAAGLLAPQAWRTGLLVDVQALVETLRGLGAAGVVATATLQGVVAASGILPASFLGMAAGATYGFVVVF